jgi:hypothetical protein
MAGLMSGWVCTCDILIAVTGVINAWEPGAVNRKVLQVTKSLEASPALKKMKVAGLKGPC